MIPETCGRCVWHFDLFGSNEAEGLANCLARDYALVHEVLSTKEALCDMPGRFILRRVSDAKHNGETSSKTD
jgi:hypothetical protein